MNEFEELRPTLFAIAYNMLGSVMDAEDIVQDAYLRYDAVDTEKVRHPRAFLKTIVTRLSMDMLKAARETREEYFGPWLPAPVITDKSVMPEAKVSQEEIVSLALLVVMEQLSPLERAVFLLREVFDYDYGEIATILERSEPACRQLFSRAKRHLREQRPEMGGAAQSNAPLLVSFLEAVQQGNVDSLLALLVEDATLTSDGGGKVAAATRVIYGYDKVARFLVGLAQQHGSTYRVRAMMVNNMPGFVVLSPDGAVDTVFALQVVNGKVESIQAVRNPDKLQHLPKSIA